MKSNSVGEDVPSTAAAFPHRTASEILAHPGVVLWPRERHCPPCAGLGTIPGGSAAMPLTLPFQNAYISVLYNNYEGMHAKNNLCGRLTMQQQQEITMQ